MAFLREDDMRTRARRLARARGLSVEEALAGVARSRANNYDIFLSQTIRDAEIVLGIYDFLTEMGFTVFCDWIAAPEVARDTVTPSNAALIRAIMSRSASLLFLDTENADQSLWMCWELGWFDAKNGHVAVLPVVTGERRYYRGREFLGLYPYIEVDENGQLKVVRPSATSRQGITLFEAPNSKSFDHWKIESEEFMRPRIIENWSA